MIDTVQTFRPDLRLSRQEVEILNGLRKTLKIQERNVLCRMAFCLSCQDPSEPPKANMTKAEGVDPISWGTFAGENGEIFAALVVAHRMKSNSGQKIGIPDYFRRLVFRGILRMKYSASLAPPPA